MANERKLPRHRRRMSVSLGDRLPAITADVSAGGFCAEMPQVFVPGAAVHGTLLFGTQQVPFKGVVTWAKPGDPRANTRSRFGVKFTEVSPEFQAFFRNPEARPLVRWHT